MVAVIKVQARIAKAATGDVPFLSILESKFEHFLEI